MRPAFKAISYFLVKRFRLPASLWRGPHTRRLVIVPW